MSSLPMVKNPEKTKSKSPNDLNGDNLLIESFTEKERKVWEYIQQNTFVSQRQVREDLKLNSGTTFNILNKFIRLNRLKKFGKDRGVKYLIHPLI